MLKLFNIYSKQEKKKKKTCNFSNMRHLLFTTVSSTTTMPSSASSSSTSKPKSSSSHFNQNPNSHSLLCKHSPSATLDLLILILVLFSGAFLLTSYFSYIFNSLSLLLSQWTPPLDDLPIPYILGFFFFFTVSVILVEFCCGARSRKCEKPGCKGLKKTMEFDLQLQTEDCIKTASKEINKLPWKGGSEGNPDYECLRTELRKMAPPNGRAVLLFRARCGCPIAKLEGWGPKRGKRHKKSLPNVT
ncbi:Ribosomal protein [Quillaja saponaria]|uniref:Ribosomal protein n=1 Tax=Quillaja saponaria TaxID=32244 RepID=A0AAD7QFY4_QUISA|nr:Ribosomal protein [Quillaja saponaria]